MIGIIDVGFSICMSLALWTFTLVAIYKGCWIIIPFSLAEACVASFVLIRDLKYYTKI